MDGMCNSDKVPCAGHKGGAIAMVLEHGPRFFLPDAKAIQSVSGRHTFCR